MDSSQTHKSIPKTNKIVALIGNPNCGKTTLFNALTGLHQKTGNFPGVTVDKKTGVCKVKNLATGNVEQYEIIDLPGTYSLFPKSLDEQVTFNELIPSENKSTVDIVVIVVDATSLKRSLLLVTQMIDVRKPTILALNMIDESTKAGINIDAEKLSVLLGIPIVKLNSRAKEGIEELKHKLAEASLNFNGFIDPYRLAEKELADKIHLFRKKTTIYESLVFHKNHLDRDQHEGIFDVKILEEIEVNDSLLRFEKTKQLISQTVHYDKSRSDLKLSDKIDYWVTHPVWGFVIFIALMFVIFQSIFFFAEYPMGWIESFFIWTGDKIKTSLPAGEINNLITDGVLAGLGGIIVFIPQIALLFGFIAVLEDSGYMARVSFIMDKMMRKVGLNGRSVIPLLSGVACAVPAIMSARTIGNQKERLITILVTPLMACSARLPVYTLMISLMAYQNTSNHFFNQKGILLMGLYLLGFLAALLFSVVFRKLLKSKEKSFFIMELPVYRLPIVKNISYTIYEKVKVFLFDAGKIIIAVSIILWFLTTHGPSESYSVIESKYSQVEKNDSINRQYASEKIEASYAGIMGKKIEPIIKPLGFDWKIGIGLITSFAAREVFVGTMATIYSANQEGDGLSIRERISLEKNLETGLPRYSIAVCVSLLLFYAFAMQCMSTLAVTYRETKTIKWPVIQFAYLTALAYFASFIAFNLLK